MVITIRQHDTFFDETPGFDVINHDGNFVRETGTLLEAVAFAQGMLYVSGGLDEEGYHQVFLHLDPAVVAFDSTNEFQMDQYEKGQQYQRSEDK